MNTEASSHVKTSGVLLVQYIDLIIDVKVCGDTKYDPSGQKTKEVAQARFLITEKTHACGDTTTVSISQDEKLD